MELRVADSTSGFSMELWADVSELYTVGFVSPSGEVIERIPMTVGQETTISFQLDATRILISYQITESSSGRFLAFLRFTGPAPGIWHIRVYPTLFVAGQFHIWLPMQGFLTEDTGFLRPDPDITITDPGNAPLLLTVSTYNHVTGSLYIHSSRGFTATGQIKAGFRRSPAWRCRDQGFRLALPACPGRPVPPWPPPSPPEPWPVSSPGIHPGK